jgi:hypothetical protein
MKNIITTLIFLVTMIGYSQENIVPIEETLQHYTFETPKVYYKDVNGVFNKFIGTWRYQNTPSNPTKVFEITFYKNEKRDQGGISFTDELTSYFSYTVNGQVVYETYEGGIGYISGSILLDQNKMNLHYSEPIIDNTTIAQNPSGRLLMEYLNEGGVEKLIWNVECYLNQSGSIPFRIPITMTLIKQ